MKGLLLRIRTFELNDRLGQLLVCRLAVCLFERSISGSFYETKRDNSAGDIVDIS